MERPIEKYGWYKYINDRYERFESGAGGIITIYKYSNVIEFDDFDEQDLSLEELQAIYETAKQIKEEYERTEKETNENVAEELKRYEEKFSEDYEEYKKAEYRELEKEEISNKSCWTCSHFRGGYIGAGCWCSQEKCDYKENDNVLIPQ